MTFKQRSSGLPFKEIGSSENKEVSKVSERDKKIVEGSKSVFSSTGSKKGSMRGETIQEIKRK